MPEKGTIIVTGSSGLIGGAVCTALMDDGYRIMGFDRPGIPHPPANVENIPCDITSDQSVSEALTHVRRNVGDRIASVIHLAAYYDFNDTVHVKGVVSMARLDDPASASTSFFIVTAPSPVLDGKYTAFGQVVSGLEVVEAIEAVPVNGDAPVARVDLKRARVEKRN